MYLNSSLLESYKPLAPLKQGNVQPRLFRGRGRGAYNSKEGATLLRKPMYMSSCNLLRGFRGLISTVIMGGISAHEPPNTAV